MSVLRYSQLLEISGNSGAVPPCDFMLDRFYCFPADHHVIESPEFGDTTIYPLACSFSKKNAEFLAIADDSGGVLLLDSSKSGPQALITEWLAHKNAIFDIDWVPGKDQILTASGDQTVAVWDVPTEVKIISTKGHTSSVKTIQSCPEDSYVFASGSRDGQIMLWDSRVKPKDGFIPSVNIIKNPHAKAVSKRKHPTVSMDKSQGVSAVIFQDTHTLISSGSSDGSIKMWDLRKTYSNLKNEAVPKHVFKYSGTANRSRGYSSLSIDSTKTRVFASCLDDCIYQYNCLGCNDEPVSVHRGHSNSSFYIRSDVSYDSQYLITGSTDGYAYIWNVDNPQHSPILLNGHLSNSEVSCAMFCPNETTKIVTLGDDSAVKIWRLGPSNPDSQAPERQGMLGFAERKHRDIGVNASYDEVLSADPPSTPRKGHVIPPSPAKISETMKMNISSLVKTASTSKISVDLWLKNASKKTTQASGKTPKKLVLTNSVKCNTAKRKLCEIENSPPTSHKRTKHDADDTAEMGFLSGVKSLDDQCSHTSVVKREGVKRDLLNDLINKTPVKTDLTQSPTINLPNYVINPLPRTPVGAAPVSFSPAANWLQQMSATKRSGQNNQEENSTPDNHHNRNKSGTKTRTSSRARGLFNSAQSPKPVISSDKLTTPTQDKTHNSKDSKESVKQPPTEKHPRQRKSNNTPVSKNSNKSIREYFTRE